MRRRWTRVRDAAALALVASVAFASAPRARAEGAIDPEVTRRADLVGRADGPAVYAALRSLVDLWELADPTQVEAALESASEDPKLSPAARVYAQILVADARKRRGDTAGAGAIVGKLGFLNRWLFVGPFDNRNKVGLDQVFQPETELEEAIVPGRAYDGKERPVRFRDAPGALGSIFDFGDWVRPRDEACGIASTFLTRAKGSKASKVSVWVGAEGAFKLWKNGDLLLSDPAYRDLDYDRSAATMTIGDDVVRLTIKVCSDKAPPRFAVRIGDERGAPIEGIEATADPAVWADQVAKNASANGGGKPAPKKPAAAPAAVAGSIEGPVQAFERLTSGPKPSAATLEAYARYLVETGGDPRGEHRARDLAGRAVDAEPTVERLLFAADLAEGRNQTRAFLERAKTALDGEKVAPGEHDRHTIDLLLAQARLERSGVAWRDSVPYYDAILERDPTNLVAILGRVDLYVQANLPRTALATLEDAVTEHPHAVALLRTYALELRTVGRDSEADEVDSRWFAFRADDTAYLSGRIDQAIARRDEAGAEHWLARFVAAEPDAIFAQATAAHAYRALGHADKARVALEAALDMAPDDTGTLRALADLAGEEGNRDEQLHLMRKVLALNPTAKDVREYVEHIEPPKAREDEAYAWSKDDILAAKAPVTKDYPKRTLRELSVTTVFQNGLSSHFHQVVFEPMTDEGAAQARQYSFGYQGDKQEVEVRVARVYRADGTVAEAIESGEAAANDPSIAMYTSERNYYIQFPRLSPGDVVELRYRVDDVAAKNDVADYFGEVEMMQSDEPIGSREYVVITPKTRTLETWSGGMPGIASEVADKGDERIYRFTAKNVAPLEPEPAMPPWGEVLGQVHVSTFKSWDELGSFYWNLARDQFDVDEEVRAKVKEITKDAKTDLDKVKAIYRYVTSLRYVGLEFGIEGIKPRRCALSLARGWGDCKDKATMIVTMLREAGIDSTIVIVRTQMRGDLPKGAPANIAVFDHAIAYVPSLDLYLDGTADGAGSSELPTMDRSSVALQINQGKPKLVRLPNPDAEQSPTERHTDLTLASDGSADFSLSSTVSGANAIAWRDRYHAEGTRRERAEQDFSGMVGPFELAKGATGIVVKDVDDVEKPVSLAVRGRASSYARKEGETLSVPVAVAINLTGQLASLSSRKLDLVVGAKTVTTDERVIHVPPGMKVVSLPEAKTVDGPFGSVTIAVESQNGKVVVKSAVKLTKSRVTPDEYPAFRSFCQLADAALSQRLILGP